MQQWWEADLETYVGLLRAVNVGKANRISMSLLRDRMVERGFDSVTSLLQSGNLVFGSEMPLPEVRTAVEELILKCFDLKVAVLVRTGQSFRELALLNPFPPSERDDVYVTFMTGTICDSNIRSLMDPSRRDSEYRILGEEVIIRCRGPYHLSNLGNAFWERACGHPATTRKWDTVAKLAALVDC